MRFCWFTWAVIEFSTANYIWVRSRNCGCLVTWFCYQLIAKRGNKTDAISWPDPYVCMIYITLSYFILPEWDSIRLCLPAIEHNPMGCELDCRWSYQQGITLCHQSAEAVLCDRHVQCKPGLGLWTLRTFMLKSILVNMDFLTWLQIGWPHSLQPIFNPPADKTTAISQTIFSNAFSWMKMFWFRLQFHWGLFLMVQLTILQQWST